LHALPIDPSRFRALIVAAIVALAAAVLVATAAPADAAGRKGPDGGAFYKGPMQTPRGHGKLIWQRNATKLTPIAGARLNKTILYTSRDPDGDRVVDGAAHAF